ncbi:MAG: STAS domain-containing protein [Gammaproteobacteria bacterium]|nr:STAS domain-containing protein [Gammaproteobacteria bacterium]
MNAVLNFEANNINNQKTEIMTMPVRFSASEAKSFPRLCISHCQNIAKNGRILLDFSKTQFIDSSGIGALVKSMKDSKKMGVELFIINPGKQICSVLKMTGLEHFLLRKKSYSDPKIKAANLPTTHASVKSRSKRIIDIIGSLVGLSITSLLFIPIAFAIKINSRGPLFFWQTRRGWLGNKFTIYKFRTMCADAESRQHEVNNEAEGAIFKNANDPRITRVGNFLRKTSLDELPQFWNVLKGEMSLVGTRPPTLDEVDKYYIPHWQRLDVKPGITGEWQVNGRSSVKKFEDIIQLDLRYQKQWSILYDIKLVFKTIAVIFSKNSGAL